MHDLRPVPSGIQGFLDDGVEALLLLDFDGVFNAMASEADLASSALGHVDQHFTYPNMDWVRLMERAQRHPGLVAAHELNVLQPTEYDIRVSTEVVSRISRIASIPTHQIVWISTWRQGMGGMARTMGLTSAREQFFLPWHHKYFYNKVAAVREFLWRSSGDFLDIPVLWADDEMDKISSNPLDGIVFPRRQLLLSPRPSSGLSLAQVAVMEDFLDLS